MLSRFLLLAPSFIEKEALTKFQIFHPMALIAFINQGEIAAIFMITHETTNCDYKL